MVKIYKDLGKTAKKLLNDDYISGDKKVQLKTTTDNGMTYTSTGVLSGKDESLAGDLSCKYKVSGTTMTTKMFTSGKMTHEAVLEKLGGKDVKLTILGAVGAKNSLTPTVEFVHPNFAAMVGASVLGAPSLHPAVTFGSNGVTAGVQGDLDVETKEVKNVQGVVSVSKSKDSEATVWVMDKGNKYKMSYSHTVSPDFSVAGEFVYDKTGDSRLLTVGTKSEIDRDTTLKTKYDSSGKVSLSYMQEIRRGTTLTLSSTFDVRDLSKSGQKFGLSLVIE